MTKKELIKALETFDDDHVVTISDGEGWANIEKVIELGSVIAITIEKHPVFSEN